MSRKRDGARNFFPMPQKIFNLGMNAGEIAMYAYLMFRENRKTYQCYPSYRTIGEAVEENSRVELSMIWMRVRSGMENAKAKVKQIGRPQVSKEDIPASFLRHYPAYKSKQLNVSELARVCDISRTTAYKYIRLLES